MNVSCSAGGEGAGWERGWCIARDSSVYLCAVQSAREKESFIFASYCSVNPKHQSQSLEGN